MRVELADHGGVMVARVEGDVDFMSADDLAAGVTRSLPDDAAGVVLDLSEVRYVDSGGVRVLFQLADHMAMSRRRLAVAVPDTSPVRRLIKVTRLEEVAFVCPSVPDCLEMIRAGSP